MADGSPPETGGNETKTQAINIEMPGEHGTRYVSVEMPVDQYETLDDLKEKYGLTWRGVLMHTHRELDGTADDAGGGDRSQYELANETRRRHGLTWRGMLLFAGRDLQSDG